MKKILFLAVCLATTTVFASCEPADEPGADTPAFVEFSFSNQRGTADIDAKKRTVKAVAECGTNLASLAPEFKLSPDGTTATVDGALQQSGTTAQNFTEPIVYTLATPDGETAEWTVTITLPDDCPQAKKYITYNKPVEAYFIEYNGGAVDANKISSAGNNGRVIEAYENKKYAYVAWDYDYFECDLTLPNGDECQPEDGYLKGNVWYLDKLNNNENWASDAYLDYEYPLDAFAFLVSKRTLGGGFLYQNNGGLNNLADIVRYPTQATMPDNTDVTQFYVRSEKVCDIMCDVYKIPSVATFWVDPATGFTLKLETADNSTSVNYEVTEIVVGKPDWDGKHLHPLATDTVIEP